MILRTRWPNREQLLESWGRALESAARAVDSAHELRVYNDDELRQHQRTLRAERSWLATVGEDWIREFPYDESAAVRMLPSSPAATIEARRRSAMHAIQLAPVLPSAAQVEEHADEYVVHLAFARPDEEIWQEIESDSIVRSYWRIRDGEVTLSGKVGSKNDAKVIEAFVDRVPGVVGVVSRLHWENGK